jgi:hypothetical protein
MRRNGDTVAGVKLDNNTADTTANGDTNDVKTCLIFAKKKKIRKREEFTAKLWLERGFNNNTETLNRNQNNRDEKCADRLEMSVRNKHDYDVLT